MSRTTNPAFQIYPADILRSADLRKCTWATRGIWWDILCLMWFEQEQGKLEGTKTELCRLIGCSTKELNQFIKEAVTKMFANVTVCDKKVTIINRRMHKDYIQRIGSKTRMRQLRQRRQGDGYTDVTPPSSSSTSVNPLTPLKGGGVSSAAKRKKFSPTLLPIPGRFCSESGCGMPAVYRTGSAYDFWYCLQHIPPNKKAKLKEQGYDV